jgi:hypothetical protein
LKAGNAGRKALADFSIVDKAVASVNNGICAYCKFLSANDTGDTGGHQTGIYIAKNAMNVLFDEPGVKGENKDLLVKIRWQDDFDTDSRFIYYGTGTRNEYRITRFGKGFPFLRTEHTGDLFILIKESQGEYAAFVLQSEKEINEKRSRTFSFLQAVHTTIPPGQRISSFSSERRPPAKIVGDRLLMKRIESAGNIYAHCNRGSLRHRWMKWRTKRLRWSYQSDILEPTRKKSNTESGHCRNLLHIQKKHWADVYGY